MRARISLVLLLFAALSRAQTQAQTWPLDSIGVEGNRNLPSAGILATAGLKKGDRVSVSSFDAARDRLIASGYFDAVAYRYKPSATDGYEVTFEVQEVTNLLPVHVEALAISTADAIAYLKTKDPLFTGRIAGARPVLDRAARVLAEYLASKGKPPDVAGRVVTISPGHFEVDFTPSRGLPVVANVTFGGSKVIQAIDLHNKMNDVAIGQPFSDASFHLMLDNQIRPLYEAKGYMRVTFPKITSEPAKEVQGLEVHVTVDEGEPYKLTGVTISGVDDSQRNHVLRTAKIPQAGATFSQIPEAAASVKDAMRHEGWLDAEVTTLNNRNDAKKTVEFEIAVDLGPLYTFGKLTVNGLGLEGEAAIRKLWSVHHGDPFPVEYPDVFAKRVKEGGYFDDLSAVTAKPAIDRDTHIVDVTVDFKGSGATDKPARKPNGAIYPGAPQPYLYLGGAEGLGAAGAGVPPA